MGAMKRFEEWEIVRKLAGAAGDQVHVERGPKRNLRTLRRGGASSPWT